MNNGQFQRVYTEEMVEFLKEYAPGHSYVDICEAFNQQFNMDKTVKQIGSVLKRNNIRNGRDMRFSTGNLFYNKGQKMSPEIYDKVKRTMFKPVNIPPNFKPVGAERINVDGYIEIKTQNPNIWKLKHRVVYEEHYGPIPKGYVVVFLDQNKLNCSIDNLKLVARKYLGQINHVGLGNIAEVNEASINLASLQVELNKRKKGKNKCVIQ